VACFFLKNFLPDPNLTSGPVFGGQVNFSEKGLIEIENHLFNAKRTNHIRIIAENFLKYLEEELWVEQSVPTDKDKISSPVETNCDDL